jgi:hypothetical protein
MAYSIDTIFADAYNAMLHHLAEQKGAKLKGLFQEEYAKGEVHFFDRIGTASVSEILSIGDEIMPQNLDYTRRGAILRGFDAAEFVYDIEKLKMLADPTNDIVKRMVNALDKNFDTVVINAILGSALTGHAGGGSQAFDTANNQIAHGGAGLTLEKLLQGLRILESAGVDTDRSNMYLIVDPRGKEDLLALATMTSNDYQNNKVLTGKSYPQIRGINIISTSVVPAATAGSVYRGILVTEDAVKIARGMDKKIDISIRKDKKDQPVQIYAKEYFGAVRMEENLCVDILFQ